MSNRSNPTSQRSSAPSSPVSEAESKKETHRQEVLPKEPHRTGSSNHHHEPGRHHQT
ncbi:MAG TPA: hypothetical protein VIW92_02305 [Thermoanaerobaculia bacterium]